MPGPTPLPPLPDYGSGGTAAVPASTGAPSGAYSPNDIWGLKDLYNVSIFMGYNPATPAVTGSIRSHLPAEDRGGQSGGIKTGKTQDILNNYNKMWAQGTAGDKNAYANFVQIQDALYLAGAYGQTSKDSIHVGQWTDQTVGALENAISSYVQSTHGSPKPQTFEDFLRANINGGLAGGGFGSKAAAGSQPAQVSLTDPNQIRAQAQQAAQQALGQGLSAEQLDAFVNAFHSSESGAQTSTAGSVTAPNLSSDALAFAEQSDPQHYANRQAQGYMNAFVNLFAPTQSQRGNIQPVPTV